MPSGSQHLLCCISIIAAVVLIIVIVIPMATPCIWLLQCSRHCAIAHLFLTSILRGAAWNPAGLRRNPEHREVQSLAQGHIASKGRGQNLSPRLLESKARVLNLFSELCASAVLPPPSWLVLALSQVYETQPETKRRILCTHLGSLFHGVEPLSTANIPLSQPPSWEGLSGFALALAWVLGSCESMAEALNSFRH